MSEKESQFKDLLDANYCWPCAFPFKFIVPADKLDKIMGLFPGEDYTSRPSRTGKYVSVTIHKNVYSSEEVVQIYEQVGKMEGVICL